MYSAYLSIKSFPHPGHITIRFWANRTWIPAIKLLTPNPAAEEMTYEMNKEILLQKQSKHKQEPALVFSKGLTANVVPSLLHNPNV